MQRSRQHSSHANSLGTGGDGQTVPVVLEFLSPAVAVAATPIPRVARGLIWVIGSMFAAWVAALGFIEIDRVVTAHGRVVSKGSHHRRAAARHRDRSLDRRARGPTSAIR